MTTKKIDVKTAQEIAAKNKTKQKRNDKNRMREDACKKYAWKWW